MTIVFHPPVLLPLILGGAMLVVIVAALLKRDPLWKKLLAIGLGLAVCGGVLLWMYRDTHLVVGDAGIRADTYGAVSIPWGEVKSAVVVSDLAGSPYAPKMRTNGSSIGDSRSGWFRLADGSSAFLTTERSDKALVITTAGTTYIFAPRDLDAFVEAVAVHVTVSR
jgi:hypothetical protein